MKRKNSNQIGRVQIYQRGKSNTWYVSYTKNGLQTSKSLKTSNMGVAVDLAKEINSNFDNSIIQDDINLPANIKEAVEEFLSHLESEGNTKSTLKRYRPIYNNWISFCNSKRVVKLSQLSQRVLEKYRISRKNKITDYTRYYETQRIVEFGKYILRHKMVTNNPFSLEGMKKPIKGKLPWFNSEQVEAILKIVSEDDASLFEFLAFTGLRISEAKRLAWEDIDLKKGTIFIKSTETNPTKTKRPRTLPLHMRAKRILLAIDDKAGLVFNSGKSKKYPLGDGPINERRLLTRVKKACAKLDFPGTLHSFRKFFCSYCANNGVPILTLKAWIGHSKSTSTLEEHYYLLDELDSVKQMEDVSRKSKDDKKAS